MSDEQATYCVVVSGEGVHAVRLAKGFASMLDVLRNELWMDGDAPEDEWKEWVEHLNDESAWTHHDCEDERRFRFATELGETGDLTIYRCDDEHPL